MNDVITEIAQNLQDTLYAIYEEDDQELLELFFESLIEEEWNIIEEYGILDEVLGAIMSGIVNKIAGGIKDINSHMGKMDLPSNRQPQPKAEVSQLSGQSTRERLNAISRIGINPGSDMVNKPPRKVHDPSQDQKDNQPADPVRPYLKTPRPTTLAKSINQTVKSSSEWGSTKTDPAGRKYRISSDGKRTEFLSGKNGSKGTKAGTGIINRNQRPGSSGRRNR